MSAPGVLENSGLDTIEEDGADFSDVVLGVRHASKRYGRTLALNDVSVSVHRNEAVALIGANGAGKSTLVRVFTGAITPDSGTVIVDGREQTIGSVREARSHGIGYVPQELTIAPDLTVAENVLAGGWQSRGGFVSARSSNKLVAKTCERVGLHMSPKTLASRLSPAERRLLMIARGMVMGPSTLILDEPTAALADREAGRIVDVLNQLRGDDLSIVYISHRMEEIARLCDTVVVLRDGKLLMRAPATEENVDRADEVGVAGGARAEAPVGEGVAARSAQERAAGHAAVRVSRLRNRTLDDVSMEVRPGEIVGLAGLLGSGRTELLRAIAGADRVASGDIEIFGEKQNFRSPANAIAAGIALIPEDRRNQGGLLSLTVQDNLVLPAIPATRGGWLRRGKERAIAEEVIERFGIKCGGPDSLLATLSGGNQQKVILARWMLTGTRILLLDEPTAGIDVVAKAEILGLVRGAVQQDSAAIVASSELSDLCGFCDRIYVLRGGAIRDVVDGDISVTDLARLCGERDAREPAAAA